MNKIMVVYKGFTGWFNEGDYEGIRNWKIEIDESM
jgi:hypothetical protein